MIVILRPDVAPNGEEVRSLLREAARFPGVTTKVFTNQGESHSLTFRRTSAVT